jgi:beta-mannosidase
VEAEAGQQLRRLGCHPSVVTFCGGSEVEQQAAMFGAPGELWTNDYFSRTLPSLVERVSPGTPYWPSTPTGGALPFHLGEGLAHYFGVGAYKRPLEDARTAAVKFTPECLGFANVPEPANLRQLSDGEVPPHHPAWKAGVPRDTGAGWDFDDIRDHYLERIHGIDAVELRGHDPDRYLKLSRTVTGRVMARVFDEWRSPDHPCSGGLVWFLRDLRPGAGWGIIDSGNRPKAVYYHLRRAWSPVRLALLDRGLDGLRIELHNEGRAPIAGDLDVVCFDTASVVTARGSCPIAAPALGTGVLDVEGVLGHFADPNYAYRFGPRRHVAVVAIATLSETAEPLVSVHWPDEGHELPEAELDARQDGSADNYTLRLGSARLVRDVRIEHDGWSPADNYFDLVPERPRTVGVVGEPYQRAKRGFVEATNARASVRVAEPT